MTPYDVANGLAGYLKERLAAFDERLGADSGITSKTHVYAGFLPRSRNVADMEKLCPAIVVRPEAVTDSKDSSTVSIVLYATVYDKDLQQGYLSLFHLLEFARVHLLEKNPVNNKYWIQPGMKTTVPDEQPYPQWIGVIEFDVMVPLVFSPSELLQRWTQ